MGSLCFGSHYIELKPDAILKKYEPFEYSMETEEYVYVRYRRVNRYKIPIKNEFCDEYIELLRTNQLCKVVLKYDVIQEVISIPVEFTVVRLLTCGDFTRIITKDDSEFYLYTQSDTYVAGNEYSIDKCECWQGIIHIK